MKETTLPNGDKELVPDEGTRLQAQAEQAGMSARLEGRDPRTDPAVIQYNLDNMRVAWGRVEIPWRAWHPTEEADPLAEARAGKIACLWRPCTWLRHTVFRSEHIANLTTTRWRRSLR